MTLLSSVKTFAVGGVKIGVMTTRFEDNSAHIVVDILELDGKRVNVESLVSDVIECKP